MGTGIAQTLASNGYSTVLGDIDPKYLEVGKNIHLENIKFSLDKQDYKDCDLIIECIVEKLEVKKVFRKEIEVVFVPIHLSLERLRPFD